MDKRFLLEMNEVKNVSVKSIKVKRLKHCSEITISVLFDTNDVVVYAIDLNDNYNDELLFNTERTERLIKKLFDTNDKRYLVKRFWDYLERDDMIPFIGALIDNQVDIWDSVK